MKTLKEAIDNLGNVDEGAKFMFVSHREAVDDIIKNNNRLSKLFDTNAKTFEDKKAAAAFNRDALKLEKALTTSVKLARKFWADWNGEF